MKPCTTRAAILENAERLFVSRGYAAVSFASIASATETSAANILHHFGNKAELAALLLEACATRVLDRYRQTLTDATISLRAKLDAVLAFNRERYFEHNLNNEGGPWSLITRFRLDLHLLAPRAQALLQQISGQIEALVQTAVDQALSTGELSARAPKADIACQLVCLIRFNQFIVTDAGRFAALEQLFAASARTIFQAYSGCRREMPLATD